MRGVKTGFLAVAAIAILGASAPASACPLFGSVVCSTDPSIGVSGVAVTFTAPDGTVLTFVSGADGSLSGHVAWNTTYDVSYTDAPAVCNELGEMITLAPIQVYDAAQCPALCAPVMPAGITFPYCPSHPIGNPKAECDLFSLVVLDKTDGAVTSASTSAPVALVKAGNCYSVYLDIQAGDPINPPFEQGVSHVTYCTCK